jgi:hypothetical protein
VLLEKQAELLDREQTVLVLQEEVGALVPSVFFFFLVSSSSLFGFPVYSSYFVLWRVSLPSVLLLS